MESVWIFKLGLSFSMKSISNTKQSNFLFLGLELDGVAHDRSEIYCRVLAQRKKLEKKLIYCEYYGNRLNRTNQRREDKHHDSWFILKWRSGSNWRMAKSQRKSLTLAKIKQTNKQKTKTRKKEKRKEKTRG